MENFIFYYTLYRDFKLALARMQENKDFTKNFIVGAKKICELESQTFLTDESKSELKNEYYKLQKKIDQFASVKYSPQQWRLFIGLMCTFDEWCKDTDFFNLSIDQQKFIFPENPVDGYYKNIKRSSESKL